MDYLKYTPELKKTGLFEGISDTDIQKILSCTGAVTRAYTKGEYILRSGTRTDSLYILISGAAQIESEDIYGGRAVISHIAPGGLFAEAVAYSGKESPVSVIALTDASVLLLPQKGATVQCSYLCGAHSALIANMLKLLANKNIYLNAKISVLSQKSIRAKISAYFGSFPQASFSLPYSRTELADYLSVNRSALSRELSNMKTEGKIAVNGRKIKLLKPII